MVSPYGGCSKDTLKTQSARCVRQLGSHNVSVFALRIHLWRVSSKYPANMKSGPRNPLNKHSEKPADRHANRLEWNFTFCVLLPMYSGMFLFLWIANNKHQNICREPLVWVIVGMFFFPQICSVSMPNTCRRCNILGHIWVQLTNQLHICHIYNTLVEKSFTDVWSTVQLFLICFPISNKNNAYKHMYQGPSSWP